MKRTALAVAVVVMAAGACKKAENANMAADTTHAMSDSMKMAPGDTAKMMGDTSKAHAAAPAPAPAAKAPAPAPARPRTKRP